MAGDIEELRAAATSGQAGREAYREGRAAVVTDQKAAIDAALTAATGRNAPEPAKLALDAIIRPTGDAAAARLGSAGERYDVSRSAIDSSLSTFKGQMGGAEKMAYDLAFSESKRIADERRAAEAERQHAENTRNWFNTLNLQEKQRQQLAPLLAEDLQAEAIDSAEKRVAIDANYNARKQRELKKIAGDAFDGLNIHTQSRALRELYAAQTEEEALAVIEHYAPMAAKKAATQAAITSAITGRSGTTSGRDLTGTVLGTGARPRDTTQRDSLESLYEQLLPTYAADERAAEQAVRRATISPFEYQRQAYIELGGDPVQALIEFPENYTEGITEQNRQADYDFWIENGMTPAEAARAEKEELGTLEEQIAASVGTSPRVVTSAARDFGIDEVDAFEVLADPVVTQVVSEVLTTALSDLEAGEDPEATGATLRENLRTRISEYQIDPAYANMLLAIALEQYDVYAKVAGG